MAHIKTPSLDWSSAWGRLEWLSEVPSQVKRMKELRDKVRGRQESADGVAYDRDIQDCLEAFDAFITQRAQLLWRPEWSHRRRMLDVKQFNPEWFSAESPETESHETELHEYEMLEYEMLESVRKKCHTASHQLKKSRKYDCKELDDILRLMEKFHGIL